VELVTQLPGERSRRVEVATLARLPDGSWEAVAVFGGHIVPNTRYRFRFRAVSADGITEGPVAEHLVSDRRVAWRSMMGDGVGVWWHEGDEGFARRTLAIAEEALADASDLLGTRRGDQVDVFVYGDARTFRAAMGPATRENVGGQAHPAIRTLFGLIEPSQAGSDWVDELVRHELAHLVFDDAVTGSLGYPPRWLNEGVAVYLARGHGPGDRAQVEAAARGGTLIPLAGLAGQFPTRPRRFSLAYAESVAAVAHLVDRHGEHALAAIVRAYAGGAGDDGAFREAVGMSVHDFEVEWLATLGVDEIVPFGPRPAPPGPPPAAWLASPAPLIP
jgi:hypothetical protein